MSSSGKFSGEVYASELQGAYAVLHVNVNSNDIVHIRTGRAVEYPIGTQVRFDIDPSLVRFFDTRSERSINREMAA